MDLVARATRSLVTSGHMNALRTILPLLYLIAALPVLAEADDQPAIDQGFNDWADGLCKDGYLHLEQFSNYGYVGKGASE